MFKKNTAVVGFGIGHFINATTGAAVTTGTPTCKRTLDGTGGACTNAAVYNTDGAVWEIDLAAGDMNGDMVILSFTMTDCLPISYTIKTVTKLVSDLKDQEMRGTDNAALAAVCTETRIARLDAAISSRNATTPPTVGAIRTELEGAGTKLSTIHAKLPDTYIADNITLDGLYTIVDNRLTADRAGYLDKLNVSGTLAHSNAANTYKADVSGLATSTQIGAVAEGVWAAENRSLTDKANFTLASSEHTSIATAVWASTTRTLSSVGTLVADTAAAVWAAVSRTITGTVTVGTNNDKSGYSLQTAPPTTEQIVAAIEADGGTLESIDDALTLLVQIGTADIKVNMTTTPWQEEYYVSGTAMLLFAKKLYDKNGNPVTTEETYAAYKQETAI